MCHVVAHPGRAGGWIAWLVALSCLVPGERVRADELGSAVYVRSDSDGTVVVSPHLRWQGQVDAATTVDAAYTVDVWSSASIDVRTSATQRPRVTEQRDEIDVGVTRTLQELTLGASYRYSVENDYTSHGVVLTASQDLAQRATTLTATAALSQDAVGRAGYPQFSESLTTGNLGLSVSQVLDPSSIVQLSYDLIVVDGYQASPYRYVGIDGVTADGACVPSSPTCQPEQLPLRRTRHALALQARRALGARASLGGSYRYYADSWALSSHTVDGRLSYLPSDPWTLQLNYRYYQQGAAEFYRAAYTSADDLRYLTRDRELSPLDSGRVGLRIQRTWRFAGDAAERELRATLDAGRTAYSYDNFLGLDQVTAYELTFALSGVL